MPLKFQPTVCCTTSTCLRSAPGDLEVLLFHGLTRLSLSPLHGLWFSSLCMRRQTTYTGRETSPTTLLVTLLLFLPFVLARLGLLKDPGLVWGHVSERFVSFLASLKFTFQVLIENLVSHPLPHFLFGVWRSPKWKVHPPYITKNDFCTRNVLVVARTPPSKPTSEAQQFQTIQEGT